MRKIKLNLQCRVPSWNYCNLDVPTKDQRFSKEKCRFCASSRSGNYCSLYDTQLTSDVNFIYKTPQCIKATAGFAVEIDEAPAPVQTPQIDPKRIIRETIKQYNATVNDMLKQGYPRPMAEAFAAKYITGDN